MQLDSLDSALLRLLSEDARLSFRELAARVGSTTPTVSARVKGLEELGIILGYRTEVNPDLLGGPLRVLRVRCRPQAGSRLAAALAGSAGVERVELLAGGQIDLRFRERLHHGVRAPHDLLSGDPDVVSYEVADVLATPKVVGTGLDAKSLDVPCHQCKGPIHGAPIRAKLEGRHHVFCCTHCLQTFKGRVEAAASGRLSSSFRKPGHAAHRH